MEFKGNYEGETVVSAFGQIVEDKLFVGTNIGSAIVTDDAHNASVITIPAYTLEPGDILKVYGSVVLGTYADGDAMTVAFHFPDGAGATSAAATTGPVDMDAADYVTVEACVKINSIAGEAISAVWKGSVAWWQLSTFAGTAPAVQLHTLAAGNTARFDIAQDSLFAINTTGNDMSAAAVQVTAFHCHLLRPNPT